MIKSLNRFLYIGKYWTPIKFNLMDFNLFYSSVLFLTYKIVRKNAFQVLCVLW